MKKTTTKRNQGVIMRPPDRPTRPAKLRMPAAPPTPQPLRLHTLADMYIHSRTVSLLLPAQDISTGDQLAAVMREVMRDRARMLNLLYALQQLGAAAATLGATTLVHPADHPLVVRHTLPTGT